MLSLPNFIHRMLRKISYATANGLAQCFAYRVNRDAIKDLLKEASDNRANRFFASQAAGLAIEDLFFIDTSSSGSMSAADVIGFDFQTGIESARESSDNIRLSFR